MSIVEGVQWSVRWGIEVTEVLHSANDSLNWAEGWRAGAAKANKFPSDSVLLGGELKCHKGDGMEFLIRTSTPVEAALSDE
jgi:hypothetical protein